jgi:hypothetical protein
LELRRSSTLDPAPFYEVISDGREARVNKCVMHCIQRTLSRRTLQGEDLSQKLRSTAIG